MAELGVETVWLDLPALAGAFGRRLHDAGLPSSVERCARFAAALQLVAPVSRRRLYWTARAVFMSDPGQVRDFDAVFREVFGRPRSSAGDPSAGDFEPAADVLDRRGPQPADGHDHQPCAGQAVEDRPPGARSAPAPAPARSRNRHTSREVAVPVAPSDEERLRSKRFDSLDAGELAQLYRLMLQFQIAPPPRRARRTQRDRHGERIDLRRTVRASLRTGGDPVRLARRRRRIVRRRMVLLCDISGSMEPYARAYLQFLTCAAGGGARTEAFVFATRLTRLTPLTRALASRNPELAIQRAAAAAPDWSSGTRIGDALKTFNDRHGRRGMARGAVIVILSDGWELHDPKLVGREMQRLGRLAHRIVWVNPRAGERDFAPRASGMAAALPHCDALVSGHSLGALDEVIQAIGARRPRGAGARRAPSRPAPEPESGGSATPIQGRSVPMPSGYRPRRGRSADRSRASAIARITTL